jgi:hypothetical protein
MFSAFMSYCNTLFQTVAGTSRREEAKREKSKGPVVLRTNDVVNAELARGWCAEAGLEVEVTDQRDELFRLEASAIVIDLDQLNLMVNERLELVERRACCPLIRWRSQAMSWTSELQPRSGTTASWCSVAWTAGCSASWPRRSRRKSRRLPLERAPDSPWRTHDELAAVIDCQLVDSAA